MYISKWIIIPWTVLTIANIVITILDRREHKMSKEELIKELISDISWLKQGCQTELEIVEHIEKAIEYLQEKESNNEF